MSSPRMRVQVVRLPRARQQPTSGRAMPAAPRGRTRKLVPVAASRTGRAPPYPSQRLRMPAPGNPDGPLLTVGRGWSAGW
jgi:hypothetical protein